MFVFLPFLPPLGEKPLLFPLFGHHFCCNIHSPLSSLPFPIEQQQSASSPLPVSRRFTPRGEEWVNWRMEEWKKGWPRLLTACWQQRKEGENIHCCILVGTVPSLLLMGGWVRSIFDEYFMVQSPAMQISSELVVAAARSIF